MVDPDRGWAVGRRVLWVEVNGIEPSTSAVRRRYVRGGDLCRLQLSQVNAHIGYHRFAPLLLLSAAFRRPNAARRRRGGHLNLLSLSCTWRVRQSGRNSVLGFPKGAAEQGTLGIL